MNKENLLEVIREYRGVISEFKKRSTTQSGSGIAWKGGAEKATLSNTPYGVGDGLGTTGWCVSASQALLNDKVFQTLLSYRNAKAKLISIDIKEQFYGYCYNGSQNKWHTAILVEDNGYMFVIDITVRQFGNEFVDKDIWDFETWQHRLRSPLCKHNILDFESNEVKFVPVNNESKTVVNRELFQIDAMERLRYFTNLDESERLFLTQFVSDNITHINKHLLTNTVSKNEFNYLNKVTKHLLKLPFKKFQHGFSVMEFESKLQAINWIKRLTDNESDKIPMYLHFSDSVIEACNHSGIDYDDLNKVNKVNPANRTFYIIIELEEFYGLQSFIPYTSAIMPAGIKLIIADYLKSIYNTGSKTENSPNRVTNTIYIKADGVELPD